MKKDKVVFKFGTFTDFAGKTRNVTFCGVSIEEDFFIEQSFVGYEVAEKCLCIGVSAQNPGDSVNNLELSKRIAEGKARKSKSRVSTLYASNKGTINYSVVEAILTQELEFFKQNPGAYLKGYNKDKNLFLTNPEAYNKKFGIK